MAQPNRTTEELLLDETFLNFYFEKNEDDCLDWKERIEDDEILAQRAIEAFQLLDRLSLKWSLDVVEQRLSHVHELIEPPSVVVPVYRQKRWLYPAVAAAAVLLCLLCIPALFPTRPDSQPVVGIQPTSALPPEPAQIGQQIRIFYLPDGTKVYLKPGSTLRQATDFGQTQRLVLLEGTGRFEVAKDKNRPFIVQTNGVRTTALGTIFIVRSNQAGRAGYVSLLEGKVKVEPENGPTIALSPGEQVVFENSKTLSLPTKIPDTQPSNNWQKQQVLDFEKVQLGEVLRQLEKAYDIHFEGVSTALAHEQINGAFDTRLPLSEILDALAFSNDFKYTIKGKKIIIY